ncbi:MAG: hypothetical protein HY221_01475, partial [Candidatus Sungbacteria bacterium]|nr:hypothetical protein [Candidatus Sungbacteria bacterium]
MNYAGADAPAFSIPEQNQMIGFFSVKNIRHKTYSLGRAFVLVIIVGDFVFSPVAQVLLSPPTAYAEEIAPSPAASASTPAAPAPAPQEEPSAPATQTPAASSSEAPVPAEAVIPAPAAPKDTSTPAPAPSSVQNLSASSLPSDVSFRTLDAAYRKTTLPQADPASGALSYSYPIVVPPGRAGMEPSLALTYNSSDTGNANSAGYGWSIPIPYVERINRTGVVSMYNENYYSSSLSGELASTTRLGEYAARVETGDFVRYSYAGGASGWKAYDKHGTIYSFGSSVASRHVDPNLDHPETSTRIARWLLDEVRDANGNYATYSYLPKDRTNPNVGPLISQIAYTNHQSDTDTTPGIYTVSFVYEQKTESPGSYFVYSFKWGFPYANDFRVKTIEMRVNGVLIKKYDLGYGAGVNGARSLLSSITETGYDSSGVAASLPAMTFNYTKGFENPVQPDGISHLVSGGWTSDSFPIRKGDVYADLNGDGYADSFLAYRDRYDTSRFYMSIVMNTLGARTGLVTAFPNLEFATYDAASTYPVDKGARAGDFNGDGFADLLGNPVFLYHSDCTPYPKCTQGEYPTTLYSNTVRAGTPNAFGFAGATSTLPAGRFGYAGDMYGIGFAKTYDIPSSYNGISALDANGDGLDDIFMPGGTLLINIGDGLADFTFNSGFTGFANNGAGPTSWSGAWGSDAGVRFIDINADGLLDALRGWRAPISSGHGGDYNEVWINTGNGFVRRTDMVSPYFVGISGDGMRWGMTDYVDTNGDGIVNLPGAPTTRADLLKTITYPAGGKTDVEYKQTTSYRNPDGSLANPKLSTILWAVSRMSTSDGFAHPPHVEDYAYENGRWFFNGPFEKKFAGFEKVTKTDDKSITVSYYHQGNADNAANGEARDSYAKIGFVYKTEVSDTNGVLLSRAQTIYDQAPLADVNPSSGYASSSPVFVFTSKKIDETYNPATGSHRDRATEYTYDTTNGNLLSTRDDGEVASASSAAQSSPTFTDISNDAVIVSVEYASGPIVDSSQTHYGESHRLLTDQSGAKISESKNYYDGLSFGSLAKGNQTAQENWISDTTYATRSKSYDAFGLPLSSTDPNGNTTAYVYDAPHLYPATITNALNQSTQYIYDYTAGKPTQVTDPNGAVAQTTYDGLGRVIDEKISDPAFVGSATSAPMVLKSRTAYTDVPGATAVSRTRYLDSFTSGQFIAYIDGLGRTIQTRAKTTDTSSCAACAIVSDTSYNPQGWVGSTSLPYFSSGMAQASSTPDSILYTVYAYDALGRMIQSTDANGITRIDLNTPWMQTTYDALSHRTDRMSDAFGRLIAINEYNESTPYTTQYAYDGAGNQIQITDSRNNVRAFGYDGLGRRSFAQDLHAPTDTTFGSYQYTYDPAGNMTATADVEGKTISYAYDKLNRKTSEDSNATPIVDATFTFDACLNGIGRICTAANATSTTATAYNALGNITKETKTILNNATSSNAFITSSAYDIAGNITATTHPDGSLIANIYDGLGRLIKIQTQDATSSPLSDVVKSFEYSPTGQVSRIEYANAVVTTNTYDTAHSYRLMQTITTTPSTATSTFAYGPNLRNTSYTYDALGNITDTIDASDTNTANTAHYTYDNLSRLLTATIAYTRPTPHSLISTYAYDAVGNILTQTQNGITTTNLYEGNLGASYANPHAVTSVVSATSTTTFAYDTHGNLLSKDTTLYTWNYNDTLASITDTSSASSTVYAYDTNGARMSASTGGVTTFYPTPSYTDDGITRTLPILTPYGPLATFTRSIMAPPIPPPIPSVSSRIMVAKDIGLILSSDHSLYTLASSST